MRHAARGGVLSRTDMPAYRRGVGGPASLQEPKAPAGLAPRSACQSPWPLPGQAPSAAVGTAFAAGFGLGFLVGAQVGPIWLLCLRSTLRDGWRVGVAIGTGAAVVDTLYAALGTAGA